MAPLEGMRALDVGCGVGTIALLAARRGARALGIDANRRSIEMARYNAGRAEGSIADEVEFRAAGFEKGLRDLRIEGRSFDVATINPMRAPVGERALVYLDELGVERAVYLGPSPVSAAKDVGVMRERGWEVARLGVVDLHPETYHTMALVGLRREPGPRA
jgi:23S rRNA (uracil1939-C5)-methyltransferase